MADTERFYSAAAKLLNCEADEVYALPYAYASAPRVSLRMDIRASAYALFSISADRAFSDGSFDRIPEAFARFVLRIRAKPL